jgi:hypothetical protein
MNGLPGFVPVESRGTQVIGTGLLEIELASGTRVRIGGAVEPATIAAALSALLRHERRR